LPSDEARAAGLRRPHHLIRGEASRPPALERSELEAPWEEPLGARGGDDGARRRALEDAPQCASCIAERRGVELDVIPRTGKCHHCRMKGRGRRRGARVVALRARRELLHRDGGMGGAARWVFVGIDAEYREHALGPELGNPAAEGAKLVSRRVEGAAQFPWRGAGRGLQSRREQRQPPVLLLRGGGRWRWRGRERLTSDSW